MTEVQNRQLLHLVFGGELKAVDSTEFRDPAALHVVGSTGLQTRLRCLEGRRPSHGGQRADAVLHRAYAQTARPNNGYASRHWTK